MEVSDDLVADLEKIRQLSQDSDGVFDPTLGKIIRLWNIDGENPHVPDQSEIDTLLPEVGYEKIQVDGNNVTPFLMAVPWILVLLEKGMGCDQIMDYLQTQPDVVGMIPEPWRQQCHDLRRKARRLLLESSPYRSP